MHDKQRYIIIGAMVVIVVMLLFPPFQFRHYSGTMWNLGYSFLFQPPMYGSIPASVNIAMLVVQWLVIAGVASALWWLLKDKPPH